MRDPAYRYTVFGITGQFDWSSGYLSSAPQWKLQVLRGTARTSILWRPGAVLEHW